MCVFSNGKDLLVFNVVMQYKNAVVTIVLKRRQHEGKHYISNASDK